MQEKASQGFSVGGEGSGAGRRSTACFFSVSISFLIHIPFNGTAHLPGSTAQPQGPLRLILDRESTSCSSNPRCTATAEWWELGVWGLGEVEGAQAPMAGDAHLAPPHLFIGKTLFSPQPGLIPLLSISLTTAFKDLK